MTPLDTLVARAQRLGRPGTPEMALRWLRVAASMLADWGGDEARGILEAALPGEILTGPGTSGHSWEKALRAAEGDARVALAKEAGHRAGQPDPGKVGMTLVPVLGILRGEVAASGGPAAVERLASSLPEPVAAALRESSAQPPWRYRLIPQSYARPEHEHAGDDAPAAPLSAAPGAPSRA